MSHGFPAARESDALMALRALADAGLLATLEWDEHGVVVSASQAFLTLSGRTPEALRGRALHVEELFGAPQLCRPGTEPIEQELLRQDGESLPVIFASAPLPHSRHCVAFVFYNAEQRRRTEFEALLLGVVSHDLRNPLGVIAMAGSLLLAQQLTELQRRVVLRLDSAARRAVRLVSDLLDFTSARGGGIQLVRSARDVHDVVAQAIEEQQLTWPGRSIEHRRFGDGQALVDADRIAQVATNLLGNAIQHSPLETTVVVETHGESTGVVLSVRNYGRPIPDDLLPLLFEPMRRGTRAGYRRGSVGLGLFIVRHLVAAHGGSVEVSSSEADGTRFVVHIPHTLQPWRPPQIVLPVEAESMA